MLFGGRADGFDFEIKDSNLAKIEAVYLQGENKNNQVLLWTPEE
ncbi:hypothetical protein ACQKMD_09845 [Viridibacillus sp. NPDC096237]